MTRELSHPVTDKYLSASYINAYIECPWKFKHIYMLGMKTPPTEPLLTGSALHWIMEELIANGEKYQDIEYDEVWASVTQYVINRAKKELGDIPQDWADNAVRVASGFFDYHTDFIDSLDILAPEVYTSIEIPDTDWHLQGTIDCLLESGRIIDWKTSKSKWTPYRKVQELQPKVYTLLSTNPIGQTYRDGKITEVDIPFQSPREFEFVVFIKHKNIGAHSYQFGPATKINVVDELRDGIIRLSRYVIKSIEEENFPCIGAYVGAYCSTCPVREAGLCKILEPKGE